MLMRNGKHLRAIEDRNDMRDLRPVRRKSLLLVSRGKTNNEIANELDGEVDQASFARLSAT